ncbi:MAG: DUF3096 domain-containing protein [Chlamydiae bacterium]|nr:DUF3096 domain-containing protein [Chlamydiota bacterium]
MIVHPLVNPIVSLIAGILILIFPELLNYVVAIYLILIGIIGIFGQ